MATAGDRIFAALSTGRDTVTPGVFNRVFRHGVFPVVPEPVLALLHQVY